MIDSNRFHSNRVCREDRVIFLNRCNDGIAQCKRDLREPQHEDTSEKFILTQLGHCHSGYAKVKRQPRKFTSSVWLCVDGNKRAKSQKHKHCRDAFMGEEKKRQQRCADSKEG